MAETGESADGAAPLVSVIMPAFRATATLAVAVASVQSQTLPDWELLIVDDGSGDGTLEMAEGLAAQDPRIRVFRLEVNGGAARARNCAIKAARGRFIAFLDADDLWLPEKLDRQITFMRQTGAALCYSGFWREREGRRRQVFVPPSVTHAELLGGNVIGCLTAIYDSAQLGKVLMPDLRMRQDYALWLAILRRTPQALGLAEPLAVHRRHRGSLSANALRGAVATWRMFRQAEGLGRTRATLCLARHLLNRIGARIAGARS